jgi:hypothetical protein
VPTTGNPVGMRPYSAHAVRVADAKEIQDVASFMCVSFDEARDIWEQVIAVYGPVRSERK